MRALNIFTSLFALLSMSACQTSRAVSFQYHDATYGGDVYHAADSTSVLFLVDGLSSEILRTALKTRAVPSIADAFSLTEKGRFSYGRAVFPSLTFPNISSILTGHSVAEHPILGNRILVDGKVLNFENITNWQELGLILQRKTIFYRLAEASQTSVSYSYAFSGGATAYQETSAAAAVSYLENDYASIDSQTIASLTSLLTETAPAKWPRFIFVHFIGVDALAHAYGPRDLRVQSYLHALDAQLAPIFSILNHPSGQAVSTHAVNYALTADHGFQATPDHAPLEDVVSHMNRKLRVVTDNRVAPLFINEPMTEDEKLALAKALLQVPHVALAAVKTSDGIKLLRRAGLKESDLATYDDDESFSEPALNDYFANPLAPDMIFIPDDHSDFASGYAGNHGGLSREEMLVPVLTKDVEISRGVHPTYELLRTMGVEPQAKP